MEEQRNESSPHRNFACLKIVWEIENSFCVTYQNEWMICSPLFTVNGFVSIKWMFILTACKVEDYAEYVTFIHLERLETGDTTLPVRVFWNLSFESGNICKNDDIFYTHGRLSSRITNLKNLQEKFQDISTRKLKIEAIFLVTRLEYNIEYGKTKDLDLMILPECIITLLKYEILCDLIINTSKNPLVGHKVILSARNKLLNDIIDQYSGTNRISIPLDDATARYIIGYLYTGNLDYVLRMPSISIDEAIKYFDIKELEKYYLKDELTLSTKHKAVEFYYKWTVTDINNTSKKKSFLSPLFGDEGLNIAFRLHLELNEVNTGSIRIVLERPFPPEWKELYIAFEIVEVFGFSTNLRKGIRWSLEHGGPLGVEEFFSSRILGEISLSDDSTLSISCSFFIPNYFTVFSVVNVRDSLLCYITCEEHYILFSKRMESLLGKDKHSDLIIRCRNENFKVHKCFLVARSLFFSNVIRVSPHFNEIAIDLVDPVTFRIFFRYIYTGVLKVRNLSDVHKIYNAAVKFGVVLLRLKSFKILKNSLHISNVFDTLSVAHTHRDGNLKLAAFKFLMYNRNEIRDPGIWEKFRNERDLYFEFKDYVRIRLLNNAQETLKLDDF